MMVGEDNIFEDFSQFLLLFLGSTRMTVKYSWRTNYPECSGSTLGAKR
jgi:hypothetical protein